MLRRIKKNKYWIFIFILFIILKTSFVYFGLPNTFHPDEIYILKDPFKILHNYLNGNFSFPFNLIYYFQLLWYGLLFALGIIFDFWDDFDQFKNLIIGENEIILIWGRILSVLLSILAGIVGIKLIKHITDNNPLQYLFGITFLLNPFEIVSDIWIKYDPFVYLIFIIIIYYSYLYIFKNDRKIKKWAYLSIFIGLSIRIDLIITLIPLFLWELQSINFRSIILYFKTNYKLLLKGILIYLSITLWPLVYGYNFIHPALNESIKIVEPFWEVISRKIVFGNQNASTFFDNVIYNFKFYVIDCFILGLGPVLFILFFLSYKKNKKTKFLLIPFGVYLLVLLLFPHAAMHYFLINSVLILFSSFIILARHINKFGILMASFNLIYIASFIFGFVWQIHSRIDTRIVAREYILANSDENDLIGIEDYINPGLFPPIGEPAEILLQKANVVRELGVGTGLTLEEKSKTVILDESRKILSISNKNPWQKIGIENQWNCTFSDTSCIKKANANYIISRRNHLINQQNDYSLFIKNNFYFIKSFVPNITDVRIKRIVKTEPFFMSFYLYKKNELNKF